MQVCDTLPAAITIRSMEAFDVSTAKQGSYGVNMQQIKLGLAMANSNSFSVR